MPKAQSFLLQIKAEEKQNSESQGNGETCVIALISLAFGARFTGQLSFGNSLHSEEALVELWNLTTEEAAEATSFNPFHATIEETDLRAAQVDRYVFKCAVH